jgi:NAD(P)-dependent dehydrogenase (short-subunit alcohol dehydrogenase family)
VLAIIKIYMKKTVFITGSSAGIGKAATQLFAKRGWNVVATMRNPEKVKDFDSTENILIQKMDVTDSLSISEALGSGIKKFGHIDVLVNNAGIGVFGAFEAADHELIKKQFDTNVFGLMETIKQVLPHFRKKRKGTIVNISSGVGKVPLPMQSLYGATKFAVEGFSESLSYELADQNILVKIVLPGNIKTDFFSSLIVTDISKYTDYKDYQDKVLSNIEKLNQNTGASPDFVAEIIYKASTSSSRRLRYMAGKDISLFSKVRKLLPDSIFMKIVRNKLEA